MVSPMPRSSLRAAMMAVSAVVGGATHSAGCRPSMRATAENATVALGRSATRIVITQARTEPVTGARSRSHPAETHTDAPIRAQAAARASVNFTATRT